MFYTKRKIQLAPRLRYGVGRGNSYTLWFKIGSALCLIIAVFLIYKNALSLFSHEETKTPQVLGTTDQPTPQGAQEQFIEYAVQKDDTLFLIGQQYDISWTTLMVINNLDTPDLKVGQKLKIPTK